MEPPTPGNQTDTKNGLGSARRDKTDTADNLHHQASTQSADKSTCTTPSSTTSPVPNPDQGTPGFIQAFSNALDIAAIADSVLQRASEARYRSLVIDTLAKEARENSKAVTEIAHDVCRAAVAASLIALETTNSSTSVEDAYATYVDARKPPINLEQFQGVMHFAQSHKDRHHVGRQMNTQTNSGCYRTSTKPRSQSRGRTAKRETRSAPSQRVSRSRSRSPETFHEKFPSTVVQCMEEFVQKCSSCSSLPSLPEDEEIGEEFSLDQQEESGPDAMSSCSSMESSPHVSPREDKPTNIYQDLRGKMGLLHRNHSPPLPQLRKVSDCELVEETTRTKMSPRMLETSSRSRSPSAESERGKAGSRPCSPLAVSPSCDSGPKADIQVLGNNTQLFQPQISRSPNGSSASSTNTQHNRPSVSNG
ncbi:uncharacterized protein [Asterias amurensis]|uniref:uncharacterized protein n=1 Tax=Asterias amurensis TaxID=7602 RepID=UPI003AB31ACD